MALYELDPGPKIGGGYRVVGLLGTAPDIPAVKTEQHLRQVLVIRIRKLPLQFTQLLTALCQIVHGPSMAPGRLQA